MRLAIFLFGMFFPFLANAQDVVRPSASGDIAQFNDDCIYRIPPCSKDDGGGVFSAATTSARWRRRDTQSARRSCPQELDYRSRQ